MILRWIQPDNSTRKASGSSKERASQRSGHADSGGSSITSPYAVAHPSTIRPRIAKIDDALDEIGESEFNAILEQVCDTVMPRMPVSKPIASRASAARSGRKGSRRSGSDVSHGPIPWSTLFQKLGEETSGSLGEALAQLQDIVLLYPNVAPAIANVTDRIEHARRIAVIAQQFTQMRGSREAPEPELMSLRQVISDAITGRARWLHRRSVKARLGLLDSQVYVSPPVLVSLIDELINWAGAMAQDIDFAVREPSPDRPWAQLLVLAKVDASSIEPSQWQNVGWYLWHQLASSLGARAELHVTQEALSVTVDFAVVPTSIRERAHAETLPRLDSQLDTDLSAVIAGCRVMLLMPTPDIQERAHAAVSRLGLQLSVCVNMPQALVLLGLRGIGSDGSRPYSQPLPYAIVYEDGIDSQEVALLRMQLQEHWPDAKIAFVEISGHLGSDVHVSHIGDTSTAHVAAQAIRQSLAPALIFELCKVL